MQIGTAYSRGLDGRIIKHEVGKYPWRDIQNAGMADALIAVLTTKPMTGVSKRP
jgi:hypothetical protein